MKLLQRLQVLRGWFPVPNRQGRPKLWRWIMLDGRREAVAAALLTTVFVSLLTVATLWSFEMSVLLTEESTVENVLNTFLSGIILLVSVVVSINSIFLSQDMTSVDRQHDRFEGVDEFWQRITELSETSKSPSNLKSFLEVVTITIEENAEQINTVAEETNNAVDADVTELTEEVVQTFDQIRWEQEHDAENFSLLWLALKINYGHLLDEAHVRQHACLEDHPDPYQEALDALIESMELFAIGREYFKTMYYTTEVSRFSRVLLITSLPAIIITSSAILAISAGLLPEYWVLGLPPLHSFVATVFTVALVPYIVLTSFVLRLSTVARLTNAEGLVSMR